jgi:hypothetical protein
VDRVGYQQRLACLHQLPQSVGSRFVVASAGNNNCVDRVVDQQRFPRRIDVSARSESSNFISCRSEVSGPRQLVLVTGSHGARELEGWRVSTNESESHTKGSERLGGKLFSTTDLGCRLF